MERAWSLLLAESDGQRNIAGGVLFEQKSLDSRLGGMIDASVIAAIISAGPESIARSPAVQSSRFKVTLMAFRAQCV